MLAVLLRRCMPRLEERRRVEVALADSLISGWASAAVASAFSRAASSGGLVMPSMNFIKRSPYGSGLIGESSFLSLLRPSVNDH